MDGVVRYVGKGSVKERIKDHLRIAGRMNRALKVAGKVRRSIFYNRLALALRNGAKIENRVVASGLSHEDAFALEKQEIAKSPDGQLWNEMPGGTGASSDYLKKLWADPERVAKHRAVMRDVWAANPSLRLRRFAERSARQQQSGMLRAKWRDPEYRAMQRIARAQGKKAKRKRFSEKASQQAKQRWADPTFRAKAIRGMRAAWADPDLRRDVHAKLNAIRATPEHREKMRQRSLERWSSPEFRARVVPLIVASNKSRKPKANDPSAGSYSKRDGGSEV